MNGIRKEREEPLQNTFLIAYQRQFRDNQGQVFELVQANYLENGHLSGSEDTKDDASLGQVTPSI